jgi:methylenetetrahydrofolate dehydrogenase (NADP+)/methenyltetrahydrofolate cyclohydrolase
MSLSDWRTAFNSVKIDRSLTGHVLVLPQVSENFMSADTIAKTIDGKAFAANIRGQVTEHVTKLKAEHGITPGLAVILVGEDPASEVYVRNKGKQTHEVGMNSYEHKLDANTSEVDLLALIDQLNNDPKVHGILCQLPLPAHLNEDLVINSLSPDKDVDGFHISNVGLLNTGQKSMVPCTPLGCLMMLRDHHGSLSGLNAVVVGRSNIVGKPMANLLLRDSCTVTIAHSRTKNIEDLCRAADIVIAAVGRPEMITGDWIGKGATVIDVGINRIPAPERGEGKMRLVGDVHFESASKVAGAITPVPGGVGPMTIACLLANTLTACTRANNLPEPEGLTA